MSLTDDQRNQMNQLLDTAQKHIEGKISDDEQEVLAQIAGIEPPKPTGLTENGKPVMTEPKKFTREELMPSGQLDSKTVVQRTSEKAMEIVGDMHQAAVLSKAKDEDVQTEVKGHASDAIHSGLKSIDDEIKRERCTAFFNRHKEIFRNFGLEAPTEMWDMWLKLLFGSVWLAICDVIIGITMFPINLFTDVFGKKIKNVTLLAVLAVLIWLAVLFSPLIGWGISRLIQWIQSMAG